MAELKKVRKGDRFGYVNRDCREMPKKVFDFPNELIDKVIEIS